MNVVEFSEFLVKNLVSEPDLIKVSEFEADEDVKILEILVPSDEIGKVIGKGGKNISAIRTLIQAYASSNNMPRVKVNIDSF